MAGQRQPIALVQAKGKKHLTKAEIAERERTEVKAPSDRVTPPSYLTATQKKAFRKTVKELRAIDLISNLDVEALARLVIAQEKYREVTETIAKQPLMVTVAYDTGKKDAEGNLINVDDNAICIYEMENGAVGTMTASWTYYGEEDNSTIIYGSEGILKIYDDPNYSIVRIGKDGTKIYYELDKMQTNDNQTKSGIIDSWVAAIKNDTVPEVNGKDALDAMKAIFAALESSESGQTVEITEED